jgi:preprotein translocase subunit SecD
MSNQMNYPPVQKKNVFRKFLLITAIIVGAAIFMVEAGFILNKFGLSFFTPKNSVIYEPNLPNGIVVSQADLEQTAAILEQRWSALGYGPASTSFTVSDGKIIAEIPAKVDSATIDQTKITGLVEFVDFDQNYFAPGTVVETDFAIGSPVTGTEIPWHTIMTNQEFKSVSVAVGPTGNFQVMFTLTETGKEILADFTSENIGSYLGIILDKKVISCPVVNGAITEGQGVIDGSFTKETAQNLAAILSTQPLFIPLR